jgi:hypothetical protein
MSMNEELPRWDIEPQLAVEEILPIPVTADRDWCALVNFMYGNRNYKTEIFSDHFLRSKLTTDDRVVPANYEVKKIVDAYGELEAHSFVGFFMNVSMRKTFNTAELHKPLQETLFARLSYVVDLDYGIDLCKTSQQHVLVPLMRMDNLFLERR